MTQQWYSLKQVAEMFGMTPQSIYRKVEEGLIPCDKSLGPKSWRIPRAWCENPAAYTQEAKQSTQIRTQVDPSLYVRSGDTKRRTVTPSVREKMRKSR